MASLEKLMKSLDSLNFLHSKTTQDETSARRKEKISLCATVTEMICSPNMKAAPNYSDVLTFAIESLLRMCNDNDTNVRMMADESLNKVIKAVIDSNIQKVLYELFKEMKKNEKARSLQAALWRFADLSHFIRAQKGRNYMTSLIPILSNISTRTEDTVLETLASSIPKIFVNLAYFATNTEVKLLTHKFLRQLSNPNTVHRRCAVQCVIGVSIHSRDPHIFLQDALTHVLDSMLPSVLSSSNTQLHSILGGLLCLSQILAQYRPSSKVDPTRTRIAGKVPDSDTLLKVFELCLHLQQSQADNISVVMAGLECLSELLEIGYNLPRTFLSSLSISNAFVTSRIFNAVTNRGMGSAGSISKCQSSISSAGVDDDSILGEDPMSPAKCLPGNSATQNIESWMKKAFGSLDDSVQGEETQNLCSEPELNICSSYSPPSTVYSEPSCQPPSCKIEYDIGSLHDSDTSVVVFIMRFLTVNYLLSHSSARVGVQTVTIEVLTRLLRISPFDVLQTIDKHSGGPRILDILLSFSSHEDPQVRGLSNVFVCQLLVALLSQSGELVACHIAEFDLTAYLEMFIKGIEDESATCSRLTLSGLKLCLPSLLNPSVFRTLQHARSKHRTDQDSNPQNERHPDEKYERTLQHLLQTLLNHTNCNTYWLNHIKLIELISILPYHHLPASYQRNVINDVVIALLRNEDTRVRVALVDNLENFVHHVYPGSKCGYHGNQTSVFDKINCDLFPRVPDENRKEKETHGEHACNKRGAEDTNELNKCDIAGKVHGDNVEITYIEKLNKSDIAKEIHGITVESTNSNDCDIDRVIHGKKLESSVSSDCDIARVKDDNNIESSDSSNDGFGTQLGNEPSFTEGTKDDEIKGDILGKNSNCFSDNHCFKDNENSHIIDSLDILNLEKIFYICCEDVSKFTYLGDDLIRMWNSRKLEMLIDIFQNVLISETSSLGNKVSVANTNQINGCVDLLNKLSKVYPIEEYKEIWLQPKCIEGSNSVIVILLKLLFTNLYSNIDLPSHCSILNLLVKLLVGLNSENAVSSENQNNQSIVTSHLVKALNITASVVAEANKVKTNTLKKNLEKISPIKNFTKERMQTITSPKSLHLPVTSFLAQPILAMNTDMLSPVKKDEILTANEKPDLHEEFYSKLYDTVFNAHNNDRNNLRLNTDFSAFLANILDNMCIVMSILSQKDCTHIIGDVSSSLSVVMNVNACLSIKCVYYSLKCVFNLENASDKAGEVGSPTARAHVSNVATMDAPEKLSVSSPFDIFEPPSPNQTVLEPRVTQQTEDSDKINDPRQCLKKNSSSNTKKSISLYDLCITGPMNRVETLLYENLKQTQISTSSKCKRIKFLDSYPNLKNFVIKKTKQHAIIPDATMQSQYLRLFEPCIISLVKRYNATPDLALQVFVLKLLTFIVQLGFNYHNIDHELTFVQQILIKQFEIFQHGYVKNASVLIPHIVKFLLTLCVFGIEKSKVNSTPFSEKKKEARLGSGSSLASAKLQDDTVISINKVIHVCDELYASGQDLQEHCIPSLKHVVKHIFIESHRMTRRESLLIARPGNTQDELDTQQEVLFMNLLKLMHYHQVVFILNQILSENINGDVHHRRSTSVCEMLLRHLGNRTFSFDNFTQIVNILTLLDTFSPNVCEVDTLLSILFKLTDFNEENFTSSLGCTIILMVSVFKQYSCDEMLECIVLNKFTSFTLDWNTEVDPLHVSITLDATSIQPLAELCKLLLYLLYQVVTSYTSLSKPFRSAFHSELVLHFLLMIEHILETHALIRDSIVGIIRDEKRKKNIFFCDLDIHFREESSVLLSTHFTRLTSFLCGESCYDKQSWEQDHVSGEFYKTLIDLLLLIDIQNDAKKNQSNVIILDKNITNLGGETILQLIQVQHETPVSTFLIENVKNNEDVSFVFLEKLSLCFNYMNRSIYLSTNFLSKFSRFMISFFNMDKFAGQILFLVEKQFLGVNHCLENTCLVDLLILCSEHVLVSNNSHSLSSDLVNRLLNLLLQHLYQSTSRTGRSPSTEEKIRLLTRNLFNIKTKILGHKCITAANAVENSTTNSEQWFFNKVKALCHIPLISSNPSEPTIWSSSELFANIFSSHSNSEKLLNKLSETDLSCVLDDKQFNLHLLSAMLKTGKHLILNQQDSKLIDGGVEKFFSVVQDFLKMFPDGKHMYRPIHRFSSDEEIIFSQQLDFLFAQDKVHDTYLILMDVIEHFFGAIDEFELCFSKRRETVEPTKHDQRSFSDYRHDVSQKSNPHEDILNKALNKLKENSKQYATEMFQLFQMHFNFLHYLIESSPLFEKESTNIINKTISINCLLIRNYFDIFNIFLQENDMDFMNIINCLYRIVLFSKNNCVTITKHENLPCDRNKSQALFQLNTILQLIIRDRELTMDTRKCGNINMDQLYNLTLLMCRCDKLYTYCRIPFHSWEYIDPVEDFNQLSLATLPTEMILNVTDLHDFVLRLKYLGWHSRVHFEQTWVILLTILTVLSNNRELEDEVQDKSELYTLTICGVTELLIQTQLREPGSGRTDGRVREFSQNVMSKFNPYQGNFVHSTRSKKMYLTPDTEARDVKVQRILLHIEEATGLNVSYSWYRCSNYEFLEGVYNVNQLSYNYLHCALLDNELNKDYICEDGSLEVNEVSNQEYLDHVKQVNLLNLDIQSCLHLLIDIYSQLLNNSSLRKDIVNSVLVLSDLFDNYQHYEWMYSKCSVTLSDLHCDYSQAVHLICTTKSLCFIRIDQKREKLHAILKRIVSILNSTKTASEVLKVASMKCLFYLLEIYIEKYLPCGNNELANISEKIKNSQLLNKTLDLIYNLIKNNITWTESIELEENFTSLCLFVLETFLVYTSQSNHTSFIETLHIIVDYLCARLIHYLNHNDSMATKLITFISRIIWKYPKYQYLQRKFTNLCNDVIKKKEHYSVDVYSLFILCVYNRYYSDKRPIYNILDELEDSVDSRSTLEPNESLLGGENKLRNKSAQITGKDEKSGDFEELNTSLPVAESQLRDDNLKSEIVEDFFSLDESEAKKDPSNDPADLSMSINLTDPLEAKDLPENEVSFYKMITSKEKSYQIKNFLSDTLQEKTEKFKQMMKVRTSTDPLSNTLDTSTFYDKVVQSVDEMDDVRIKDESGRDTKQYRKGKFISYVETDKDSEESDKKSAKSSRQLRSSGMLNDSTQTVNEDVSSITNFSTDDSFAIIEIVSLLLYRIKQLNQDEIRVLSNARCARCCERRSNVNNSREDIAAEMCVHNEHTVTLEAIRKEVDVLCEIIPSIFLDFGLESDMLNRVVNEFLTMANQNFTHLRNSHLLCPQTVGRDIPHPLQHSSLIAFEGLHVQSGLSSILLHVLQHNQLDLTNDWIVSTLSSLFDPCSLQLTSYYMYVFLCFSCKHELIRDYFVNHRQVNVQSLRIIVRTFYEQLNDELKGNFVVELTLVRSKFLCLNSLDSSDGFRELFEAMFSALPD